jgi:membrane protein
MKQVKSLIGRLNAFQQKHRWTAFSYGVIKKYGDDGAGYQAALLTYYSFLALFPLLLVLTTLISVAAGNQPELKETILNGITDYFPVLGNQLTSQVQGLHGSGLALLAGILFTLYGARGVADVWRQGVHHIWGVPKRQRASFPRAQLKSLTIIVVGGLGFIGASLSAGLASTAGRGYGWGVLSVVINLSILFWLFTFLLKFNLPRKTTYREAWVGAGVASAGLVILQLLGGYIIGHELKNLSALYSYFAVPLGLLFWLYLQAQMLYIAVEIAHVHAFKLWPRSLDANHPTPVDKELKLSNEDL